MAIFTELSIVLVHTLLTTWSKHFLATLFKVTVPSKFIVLYLHKCSQSCRCLASSKDLDAPGPAYYHHEHTDLLLEYKTTQELWDDYGLVGNVEVHHSDYSINIWCLMFLITGFHPKLSMW